MTGGVSVRDVRVLGVYLSFSVLPFGRSIDISYVQSNEKMLILNFSRSMCVYPVSLPIEHAGNKLGLQRIRRAGRLILSAGCRHKNLLWLTQASWYSRPRIDLCTVKSSHGTETSGEASHSRYVVSQMSGGLDSLLLNFGMRSKSRD